MRQNKKFAYLLIIGLISSIWIYNFWFAADSYIDAANKLAQDWVIVDNSSNTSAYRVNDNITRWEMAKVTLNLSGKEISETCNWLYQDLKSTDWACKYAETWNKYGFFAANAQFRPADNITKVEALKMIMQARGIEKWTNSDWRLAYVEAALVNGIITSAFTDYNTYAIRWWIFDIATREANEWICTWDVCNFDPIIDNLLDELLWENQTSSTTQACGIENCHWMDIVCGPNVAQVCTMEYQLWDWCRQYAACENVSWSCKLQVSSKFTLCKSCVESCKSSYSNDSIKLFECESQCTKQ